MLIEIKKHGKPSKWHDAQEVFDWWMEKDTIPGQLSIDDYLKELQEGES